MNDNIRELIEQAGFSSTYEVERLAHLCKLVALQCVDSLLFSKNIPDAVSNIYEHFSLEDNDGEHE